MLQLVTRAVAAQPAVAVMAEGRCHPWDAYPDMRALLADWPQAWRRLEAESAALAAGAPATDATLLAPLPEPRNIYFTGANYTDHIDEMARALDLELNRDAKSAGLPPWFCPKATTSVVGPGARVARPRGVERLDWEVELAVIVGREGREVPVERALEHVAGYTVANDLSARDRMARAWEAPDSAFRLDWLAHKSFDGSCPLGPAITPAACVPDVQDLAVRLWVNDELMQDSHTSRMIYTVADLVSALSHQITIRPGDVILTGTPAGVGAARGRFLAPGDRVRQWIEHIGEFEFVIA